MRGVPLRHGDGAREASFRYAQKHQSNKQHCCCVEGETHMRDCVSGYGAGCRASRPARFTRRARQVLTLVATASALLCVQALAPAQASALVTNFCGLRDSGFICQTGVFHTYIFNEGSYIGSGTLEYSCEFMIRQSGEQRPGAICNHLMNSVVHLYPLTTVGWEGKCYFFASARHTYNCVSSTS